MRVIQNELGEGDPLQEVAALKMQPMEANQPTGPRKGAEKEISRLPPYGLAKVAVIHPMTGSELPGRAAPR